MVLVSITLIFLTTFICMQSFTYLLPFLIVTSITFNKLLRLGTLVYLYGTSITVVT